MSIFEDLQNLQDRKTRGGIKSQNPLTAKVAKFFRKTRKKFKFSKLPLHTLRELRVLCG